MTRSIIRNFFISISFFAMVTGDVYANGEDQSMARENECVILLHGLGRSSKSMRPIEQLLAKQAYRVVNIDYPSRHDTLGSLAKTAIDRGLSECGDASRVHFVTHSLGGVLVRQYFQANAVANLGHVVMLGPPNQGSPVVDAYSDWPFVAQIGGPAFLALSPSDGEVLNLGSVDFSLGVIAGSRTLNPILSAIIEGPDDGKVSIEDTRIQGMKDHRIIATSHPMLMRNSMVQKQVSCFLEYGIFCDL